MSFALFFYFGPLPNIMWFLDQFHGKVTYNGHGMNEFVPELTAAYVSQNDIHIGEMTVRETLAFSARAQGVGSRYGQYSEFLFFEN